MKRRLWLSFRALANRVIIKQSSSDPEIAAQVSRVIAFSLALIFWIPIYAAIYLLLSAPICAAIVLSGAVLLGVILLMLRNGVAPAVCGNVVSASAWYIYTGLALLTGGIWAPDIMWYATLPILSVLLSGPKSGAIWTLISTVTLALFAISSMLDWNLPVEPNPDGLLFLQLSGLMGLMLCIFFLVNVLRKMEFDARKALSVANSKLELQASTDGLTGIPNRHTFDQVLTREWERHQMSKWPLSVALIDADFFKDFNDEYGHLAGDDCLRSVARAIQSCIRRPTDLCARFGGEEFAVILPNTDEPGVLEIAERIRTQIRGIEIPHARSSVDSFVTISIGVATIVPSLDSSLHDFLHDVDMALYRAKECGRDRIAQNIPDFSHPAF